MHWMRLQNVSGDFSNRTILTFGEAKAKESPNSCINFRGDFDRIRAERSAPRSTTQSQPELEFEQII
jgi:hypothetical protein